MAIAGTGVATKDVTITGMICIGLGQGVQPLLGYSVLTQNCGSDSKKSFRFSILFALVTDYNRD